MSFLYRINRELVANTIHCKEGEVLEKEIEELLHKNSELVLGEKILYIGRQLKTATGKIIDLLAVDPSGQLIVIELKRGYAPRDILAQVLEYSSWLRKLSEREIENIAKNYFDKNNIPYRNLIDAFTKFFQHEPEVRIGDEIVNVLFAQEFPPDLINSTEYLRDKGLNIECMRFDLFGIDEEEKFLLVQKLFVDGEDRKITTKPVQLIASTQKQNHRRLISQLTGILVERYNNWASLLGDGLKHPISIWQSRDGSATCSLIKWNYDSGILLLECGIYIKESDKAVIHYVSLSIQRKSTLLLKKFKNSSVRSILVNECGFVETLEENELPYYTKDLKIDALNIDTISKVTIKEIEQIKPVIEKILSKQQ